MSLVWADPGTLPSPLRPPRTDWTGFTVDGDNNLEARWLEVYAESGLDWSACGFHWNSGELQECAMIAHASRLSGLTINDNTMATLEYLAGVEAVPNL